MKFTFWFSLYQIGPLMNPILYNVLWMWGKCHLYKTFPPVGQFDRWWTCHEVFERHSKDVIGTFTVILDSDPYLHSFGNDYNMICRLLPAYLKYRADAFSIWSTSMIDMCFHQYCYILAVLTLKLCFIHMLRQNVENRCKWSAFRIIFLQHLMYKCGKDVSYCLKFSISLLWNDLKASWINLLHAISSPSKDEEYRNLSFLWSIIICHWSFVIK